MRVSHLKTIGIFIVGIVIVFTLILARNYFVTKSVRADTSQTLTVFDDQLSSQFSSWSWSGTVDLHNTSPVYSGTASISFTPAAWGGLYFHSNSTITTSSYTSLQFAMQTTDPLKNFTLIFYDASNQIAKSLSLSQYAGSTQNGWTVYTIPVSDIPLTISGFALQENSGSAGPVTYVDSVQFVGMQSAPTQAPATVSNQQYSLYSDSLASGWNNWSWNSTIKFSDTNPYQGTQDISFTTTNGYGGLYLHSDQGVDTTQYHAITFAAKATQEGQAVNIALYDSSNNQLHSPVSLDSYGGQPGSDNWKIYTLPLSDLNANGKIIKGFMLQDTTGKAQQTLLVDSIMLTSQSPVSNSLSIPSPTSSPTTTVAAAFQPAIGNPLSGLSFFNDSSGDPALSQEQQWKISDPTDAAVIDKIASQPKAIWVGGWTVDVQSSVQNEMNNATKANSLPVFVAYNIPERDCGGYSSGGATSANAYQSWINAFASGIGSGRAAVILEPDALAQVSCLSQADQQTRTELLTYAVQKFKSLGNTAVYIDAGHAGWIDPTTMATTLKSADISQADGFSLNVSNFDTDSSSISYGQKISSLTGGKHFVIDTSRNGNGPTSDNQWCNPSGRALGDKPTTQTGNSLVDAYLWIKYPGESDGACNGSPAAGGWDPSYALGLSQRASW